MSSNRLTQLVAAFLILIFFAIAGCGGEQDAPPSPGTIIDFTNITPTSLTVNWTKATDDNTVQQYLEYKAVYSKWDVLGSLYPALQFGTGVPIVIENEDGEEESV
ncbi:MAG: fibronectin type III domain-containing protein, partial [Deltaproteobacteria bacterium]|nr:fibronectin type III domain-containing protein [Deltaproteobacteria bacterium]